jgi:hypothetical protein
VSLNHTFTIALHYSTYKDMKSHVKSSQADFLYSSLLLEFTACLFVCVLLSLLLATALNEFCQSCLYSRGTDIHHRKYISRDRYPASLLVRRSVLQKTQLLLWLSVGPCLGSRCLATI